MNKKSIQEAITQLKADSKERKFKQSVDLVVCLQDLNLKKPEDQLDFFMQLPHDKGKKAKICAFVGDEIKAEAEKVCDTVIPQSSFNDYKTNLRKVKTLAKTHDFFVAQANIMAQVAQVFGRALGPKGKMPNPKSGGVFPPKANLKPIFEKFQKTLHVSAKKEPVVKVSIGKENIDEGHLVENTLSTIDQVVHHLPREKHNIKSIYLKFTMSKPIKLKK